MSGEIVKHTVSEINIMAEAMAKSQLFGIRTPEQAMALMLVAQAEGLHPATAARDYNIIQGRPALKAEAMLSRFQQAGGIVQWQVMSNDTVSALFHHPQSCPKPVEIKWTLADAEMAQLFKLENGKRLQKTRDGWAIGNWQKYPRQMLRSRVISDGVRTVYPSCTNGFYTPEEVIDNPPEKNITEEVTVGDPSASRTDNLASKLGKQKAKQEVQEVQVEPEVKVELEVQTEPEVQQEPQEKSEVKQQPEAERTFADARREVITFIGKHNIPGCTAKAICEQATGLETSKMWKTVEHCDQALSALRHFVEEQK